MKRSFIAPVLACAIALVAAIALTACGGAAKDAAPQPAATTTGGGVTTRVASLKGPTSIGLVSLMSKAKAGNCANDYQFEVMTAADELGSKLAAGEVDIALIPANVAATLFNKTNDIQVVDINTLGVLQAVGTPEAFDGTLEGLAGHTVYLTGKGTTPEYVVNYLLDKAGIAGSVDLQFKSEATEVVQAIASDPSAIAILPEPFATSAAAKNQALTSKLDLNGPWTTYAGRDSHICTGVTVARNGFIAEHADVVSDFVAEQLASVDIVNGDPAAAGELVAEYGILDNAQVAAKAIPGCNLVCIQGSTMQTSLDSYYRVLFDADKSCVGGALPSDNFYWLG